MTRTTSSPKHNSRANASILVTDPGDNDIILSLHDPFHKETMYMYYRKLEDMEGPSTNPMSKETLDAFQSKLEETGGSKLEETGGRFLKREGKKTSSSGIRYFPVNDKEAGDS